MYNDFGYNKNEKGCLWIFLGVLVVFISLVWWVSAVQVTDSEALERFHELLPNAENIEIIVDSGNDNWFVHEISDVTFELLVDGKRVSGRCTDGTFREMVCRLYAEGD